MIKINLSKHSIEIVKFPTKKTTIKKSLIAEITIEKTKENKLNLQIYYNIGESCVSQDLLLENNEKNWLLYEKLKKEVFK